jgi:hypothetical protein
VTRIKLIFKLEMVLHVFERLRSVALYARFTSHLPLETTNGFRRPSTEGLYSAAFAHRNHATLPGESFFSIGCLVVFKFKKS